LFRSVFSLEHKQPIPTKSRSVLSLVQRMFAGASDEPHELAVEADQDHRRKVKVCTPEVGKSPRTAKIARQNISFLSKKALLQVVGQLQFVETPNQTSKARSDSQEPFGKQTMG
jgi:hypothetical protein